MNNLLFGTAGIPLSTKNRNTSNGITEVRNLNLDAMELEFVRGVNMSMEIANNVREISKKNKIVLTAHCPYYINLNADSKDKINASIERIIRTARIAKECGAYSIVFHAAYYMKENKDRTYENVLHALKNTEKILKDESNDIWLRPETTGKKTQWGNIKEVIKISTELENVLPCIDFSHIHARENGKFNSYIEFCEISEMIEKNLGKDALQQMHIHVSGIEYGEKGEKNHLNLENSDFKYKDLIKALKEFNAKGVVISESPNIEEDAMRMKRIYEEE
ncbi:MAG: TIM barrel protein [Candidatus Altarchaeum sp.]|nr:TIM barrel protein [Candidatus Altarchaeum sp.]